MIINILYRTYYKKNSATKCQNNKYTWHFDGVKVPQSAKFFQKVEI